MPALWRECVPWLFGERILSCLSPRYWPMRIWDACFPPCVTFFWSSVLSLWPKNVKVQPARPLSQTFGRALAHFIHTHLMIQTDLCSHTGRERTRTTAQPSDQDKIKDPKEMWADYLEFQPCVVCIVYHSLVSVVIFAAVKSCESASLKLPHGGPRPFSFCCLYRTVLSESIFSMLTLNTWTGTISSTLLFTLQISHSLHNA